MISGLLTSLLIAGMLWLWARSAKQAPDVLADGTVRVAYPGVVLGFGLVLAAIGVGFVVAMLVAFPLETARDVGALVAFAGVFAALIAPILFESRRWVLMRARGLEGHFPGRAPVHIAWREVSGVRFSTWSGYLTLSTDDGRKVRVSPFMRGSVPLADLVREHGIPGSAEAVTAFHEMRRRYGV